MSNLASNQTTDPAVTATASGFSFRIDGQPAFSFLTVDIPAEQTLKVEASAMATMTPNLQLKTRLRGGLGRMLTGESLFLSEYTAGGGAGQIGIAPAMAGDLAHVSLQGETIFLQNSAFVACTDAIKVESKWQGLVKGFFSGESLFLIRCSGTGELWFSTYGGLLPVDVDGDFVVDTGHIAAFTAGLDYRVQPLGGFKSLFFSGEGLVCRFSGRGKVWIQTRKVPAFTSWINPFRRVQKKSNN